MTSALPYVRSSSATEVERDLDNKFDPIFSAVATGQIEDILLELSIRNQRLVNDSASCLCGGRPIKEQKRQYWLVRHSLEPQYQRELYARVTRSDSLIIDLHRECSHRFANVPFRSREKKYYLKLMGFFSFNPGSEWFATPGAAHYWH